MLLNDNSEVNILNSIPKMIILEIDTDSIIINHYGDISNTKICNDIKLNRLIDKQSYEKVKLLKNKSKLTVILHCFNKEYEVTLKNISNGNYIIYFYDITKYNNMQVQLKQSFSELTCKKDELQALFDLAGNGISILDKNGIFLYANKFFQNMMGYTMEELYSKSCISLSSNKYTKTSQEAVQKAIKHGSIQNFRKVCITKNGERLNASMSLSYLKNHNEMIMITSDITSDIKYQKKLKKQVEEEVLKRTEQYEVLCHQSRLAGMGEMIDSIAHQWRQPLNSMAIIIQGIKHLSKYDKNNSELLKEIEQDIVEKITYMSQTIDDFSTFFYISKKKEFFNILNSIQDSIRLIDVQLNHNNIKIKTYIQNNIKLEILGLSNEFRQVILNIIHNAMTSIISSKEENGLINISIVSNYNKIVIEISDNGTGIKKENIEKIFDPYFTTKDKGSGIGLYMSKMIIEHHMNGILTVNNLENGAVFTIELKQ